MELLLRLAVRNAATWGDESAPRQLATDAVSNTRLPIFESVVQMALREHAGRGGYPCGR